jgi:hypothetical protein
MTRTTEEEIAYLIDALDCYKSALADERAMRMMLHSRSWTRRHWLIPLVYMVSATLYAVIFREGLAQAGVTPEGWVIPAIANLAGVLTMIAARFAWFDNVGIKLPKITVGKSALLIGFLIMTLPLMGILGGYGK